VFLFALLLWAAAALTSWRLAGVILQVVQIRGFSISLVYSDLGSPHTVRNQKFFRESKGFNSLHSSDS
jgi:hypothetical protein